MLISTYHVSERYNPAELLQELKSCGTDIRSGEDLEIFKGGKFSDGLIIEHLKKLISISKLTDEQQTIIL